MTTPTADPGRVDIPGTSDIPKNGANGAPKRTPEQKLRRDVKAGRESDLKGRTIDASLVRQLVLEADAPSGVRIRRAKINGQLDLQNARGSAGEACKALVLTDCDLDGTDDPTKPGLDARHSYIERIALIDCQTDGVELSSAVITGDLNLDGLRPRRKRGKAGACWVKARDVRVGGALTARNAHLSLPWVPGSPWPPNGDPLWSHLLQPFALDLRNAKIGGWLLLMPGFTAQGGLNIAGATIGGDLWATGAHLSAARIGQDATKALFGRYTQIGGLVSLSSDGQPATDGRFRARGDVDLYGAKIGGALWLVGAEITDGAALSLYSASVSGDVVLQPADTTSVNMSGATVGGKLFVQGAETAPFEDIDATGLQVRGNVELSGSLARMNLAGATIDGRLALGQKTRFDDQEATDQMRAVARLAVDAIDHLSELEEERAYGALRQSEGKSGQDEGTKAYEIEGLRGAVSSRIRAIVEGEGDKLKLACDLLEHLGVERTEAETKLTSIALDLVSVNGSEAELRLSDARVAQELSVAWTTTAAWTRMDWRRRPFLIRSRPLSCYRGWRLAEALFRPTSGRGVAILAFLYGEVPSDQPSDLPAVVILDGASSPIHELNEQHGVLLETEQQVETYLTFFCDHVWGDEGAFTITPGSAVIDRDQDSGRWRAEAEITYGSKVFAATLMIESSGAIEMVDDAPGGDASPDRRVLFASPIRWFESNQKTPKEISEWPESARLVPNDAWSDVPRDQEGRPIWAALKLERKRLPIATRVQWPSLWTRPQINLAGLKVASIDDGHGRGWFDRDWVDDDSKRHWGRGHEPYATERAWNPTIQLTLGGFEYERLGVAMGALKRGTTNVSQAWKATRMSEAKDSRTVSARVRGLASRFWKPRELRSRLAGSISDMRQRLSATQRDAWLELRHNWLRAQYETPERPEPTDYDPQPHQQLAKVLRNTGNFKAADDITHDKLELEHVVLSRHRVSRWFWRFVQFFFGYGLRSDRAAATFALVWILGVLVLIGLPWVMVASTAVFTLLLLGYALRPKRDRRKLGLVLLNVVASVVALSVFLIGGHVGPPLGLMLDTSAVGSVVASQGDTNVVFVPVVPPVPAPKEEVPCGNLINPFIYPLDVMIPLIDLRQETRCAVSIHQPVWGVAKGFYAIAGWIVTSGLILTVSGVVRRQVEK